MAVLDIRLDNFYAFKNFHMNLTYPKKIVGSTINEEYLPDRPNFRYKKVNIIMGANATGKTTFGRMINRIFAFIYKHDYQFLTDAISNTSKEASFVLDLVCKDNFLYHITCSISPVKDNKYTPANINLRVHKEEIKPKDSYESCLKRINRVAETEPGSYIEEIEKINTLNWFFEYPQDTERILQLPDKDKKFCYILENILKTLDPSIISVEISKDVKNTYIIRLKDHSVILQDGEKFSTDILSSGTKAGVEVAGLLSSLIQNKHSFYYCDEKFPYVQTDIEKAVLSLMTVCLKTGSQLFFTTHNTDILDMDLPRHAFTFLRKNIADKESSITCIDAASIIKRNTDSLKNAYENDVFLTTPDLSRIYNMAED